MPAHRFLDRTKYSLTIASYTVQQKYLQQRLELPFQKVSVRKTLLAIALKQISSFIEQQYYHELCKVNCQQWFSD